MAMNHHINDETLLDFASGALGEAWSIAVASHLSVCPQCRKELLKMEALGGSLLESVTSAREMDDTFRRVVKRLEAFDDSTSHAANRNISEDAAKSLLPQPLHYYVGNNINNLDWKRLGLKAQQVIIHTEDTSATARLLKIPEGEPIPEHSHDGLEMTFVIGGAYSDISGRYARGDFQEADENIEHKPIVDKGEDCICLIVTNAPLKFSNLTTRLVQPILGV